MFEKKFEKKTVGKMIIRSKTIKTGQTQIDEFFLSR